MFFQLLGLFIEQVDYFTLLPAFCCGTQNRL